MMGVTTTGAYRRLRDADAARRSPPAWRWIFLTCAVRGGAVCACEVASARGLRL
jgi:hypothetical protein